MRALFVVATAAAVTTIVAWTTAVPAPAAPERTASVGALPPAALDTTALARFAARLHARDPFRLERRATAVRYNPWEPTPAAVAPPPGPARPPLMLAGLLGGPPWNALVEGIPGREGGVLLAVGDSAGGIRFVALHGDTVLLAGFDTTWSLTARRAWR